MDIAKPVQPASGGDADIARPWPPVAAVFVFSGAHYGTFRDQARAEALRLIEVTVPPRIA